MKKIPQYHIFLFHTRTAERLANYGHEMVFELDGDKFVCTCFVPRFPGFHENTSFEITYCEALECLERDLRNNIETDVFYYDLVEKKVVLFNAPFHTNELRYYDTGLRSHSFESERKNLAKFKIFF